MLLILTEHYDQRKVKKLHGREVLYGGLPIESLKQAGIDIGTLAEMGAKPQYERELTDES